MKAILQIEELREALQKARPFVNPRAPFLAIRDIKLELGLEGDKACLTATDLEAEFSTTFACVAEEPFSVILPYRQSLCFLGKNKGAISLESSLPKGNTVKLEIEHIGRVEFNDTQLVSDFPASPKPFGDFIWTTQNKEFLRMLVFVATHACSESDSRPVLTGVLLEEGGIAAADGFRLACYELPELTFGLGEKKAILPAKSAFRLAKVFSGLKEFEVTFNDQRSMAYFRGQGMQMVSQLIQGTFPNYKLLIPTSFDYQANLSVPVLLDRLSMLNGSSGITRFIFQPNHICEIIQKSDDGIHYLIEMPARSSSEKDTFRIAFHKGYIEDAVRLFSLCDFQMTHPASPGVFKGDIEALTVIVLPMFVQWE